MRFLSFCLSGVTIGALMSSPAAAREASGSANLRLIIPEVCSVSSATFIAVEDGTVTGSLQEFCNTSTGFQIVASYRPLSSTESASVRYGTDETQLNGSGLSKVAYRSGQRLARVAVRISADSLEKPLAVAFSVVAI